MPHSQLAPTLDTTAASVLRQTLMATLERGEGVALDGSDVARVGQACLQVLASGRATAVSMGLPFAINDPSDALGAAVALSGLDVILDPVA